MQGERRLEGCKREGRPGGIQGEERRGDTRRLRGEGRPRGCREMGDLNATRERMQRYPRPGEVQERG